LNIIEDSWLPGTICPNNFVAIPTVGSQWMMFPRLWERAVDYLSHPWIQTPGRSGWSHGLLANRVWN